MTLEWTGLTDLALIVAAYGIGCLNAAYYLVRWKTGKDIRTLGTGTAGARNVGRLLKGGWSVAVFLLDFGKGVLVVEAAEVASVNRWTYLAAMLAVVAGHVWPAQLGFRGGKGVATSLGALTAFNPVLPGALAAVVLPLWLMSGSLTFGGLVGFAILLPALALIAGWHAEIVVATAMIGGLLWCTHWKDIRRWRSSRGERSPRGDGQDGAAEKERGE